MKTFWMGALAAGATLSFATGASAEFKTRYQGSEARAMQSATLPPAAGYLGAPPAPGNLSASCPKCVPGGTADPNHGAGVPNQIVTFLHPYTNKAITVPLTLPVGKPSVHIHRDKVVYDYGLFSHKVIVKFLPNGLVDFKYRG